MNYKIPSWLRIALEIQFGSYNERHLLMFLLENAKRQIEKETKKMSEEERVNFVLRNILGKADIG